MNTVHIGLTRGSGPTGTIISSQEPPYAHALMIAECGQQLEFIDSWAPVGVRGPAGKHQVEYPDGTVIDVFRLRGLTEEQAAQAWYFAVDQVDKGYDFGGLWHFAPLHRLFGWTRDNEGKWFCSELDFESFSSAGYDILDLKDGDRVHPTHLSWSPLTELIGTITWRHNELPEILRSIY